MGNGRNEGDMMDLLEVLERWGGKWYKPYRLNPNVIQWVNAFASCAIEGNELSIEMMELWNNGEEEEFVRRAKEIAE